jgi:EAL domain-containing protein (putative c-di-GMP-specific phosphodiesterase class I)
VNIAANSLRRKGLADTVDKILKETGLDAEYLELDIPGLKLSGPDRDLFKKRLEELKNLGVHIALADYGTASPFIESLQNLPLDTLKIDRAFVHNASVDPDHAAISQAIVRLARALRLKVVAEGVETAQELALLRDFGCDSVQGYLFSKPVTAQEFASQLKQGKRL